MHRNDEEREAAYAGVAPYDDRPVPEFEEPDLPALFKEAAKVLQQIRDEQDDEPCPF